MQIRHYHKTENCLICVFGLKTRFLITFQQSVQSFMLLYTVLLSDKRNFLTSTIPSFTFQFPLPTASHKAIFMSSLVMVVIIAEHYS